MLQRWEVSVQRELPARWLIEAAYIGNYGYDLVTAVDANPVFRQYQSTSPVRDQAVINFLDTPVPNPFRQIPQFEGTNPFFCLGDQPIAVAAAVPALRELQHRAI